jgi:hypothetical protein
MLLLWSVTYKVCEKSNVESRTRWKTIAVDDRDYTIDACRIQNADDPSEKGPRTHFFTAHAILMTRPHSVVFCVGLSDPNGLEEKRGRHFDFRKQRQTPNAKRHGV